MLVRAFIWLAALAAACSSSGSGAESVIDAGATALDAPFADAPPPGSCADLRDRWQTAVAAADRSCGMASDCALVGGVGPSFCQAVPFVATRCEGDPVSASAAAGGELKALLAAWDAAGCREQACSAPAVVCVGDCAPGIPRCIAHTCTVEEQFCSASVGDADPP